MAPSIVLVDDEKDILDLQVSALEGLGLHAESFTSPTKAWEYIQKHRTELVITDCNMPDLSGLDLLFKTRSLEQPPDVIILTGFGTVPLAVQAMTGGAFGFLEKPFNVSNYQIVVDKALKRHQERHASMSMAASRPQRASSTSNRPISGSDKMERVLQLAGSAAASDATILLTGESGTGKEVLADFIHRKSQRAAGPLVKVNCGALPEHLIESELFGHEKGAFTGAEKRNVGRFEQAHDGTLFLDEIGDLDFPLQVKLLRALQEHTIERLGSNTPVHVNFRLICATHRDLNALVALNGFREDLYYRINVMPIQIPPLRERAEDIVPLAQHFFEILRAKMVSGPQAFDADACAALRAFAWPGNVRQLRNAIEYALIVCNGPKLLREHLPEEVRTGVVALPSLPSVNTMAAVTVDPLKLSPSANLRRSVQDAEALAIVAALERNKWRVTQTARDLNISRSTLYQRMGEYNIKRN